jgi:hypothetical protein
MITQFNALTALDSPTKYTFKSQVPQSFLSGDESTTTIPSTIPLAPTPEPIKHMLIGSSRAVMGTIRVLHQLGYAQVGDWSPLLPSPNPGEVMSILVRNITVQ